MKLVSTEDRPACQGGPLFVSRAPLGDAFVLMLCGENRLPLRRIPAIFCVETWPEMLLVKKSNMALSEASAIVANLKTILRSVNSIRKRFANRPIYALKVSAEDPAPEWNSPRCNADEVARYLMAPPDCVVAVDAWEFVKPFGISQWQPYHVWTGSGISIGKDNLTRQIDQPLRALNDVRTAIESLLVALPKWLQERYCFSSTSEWKYGICFWNVLFHLATHYPAPYLSVNRRRWVNTLNGDPDPIGGTDKVIEHSWPLSGDHPPSSDVWPGMIWCELTFDLFTSTKSAIEVLIGLIERADRDDRFPEAAAFAGLLSEFEELAEPDGQREEIEYEDEGKRQPMLLRLGSPFSTPPVEEWCKGLSDAAGHAVPVARWQGFVELVYHRYMPPQFDILCAKGGALLPEWDGVVPLKSPIRKPDLEGWGYGDCAVPSSDVKARWIRFVFETLRKCRPQEVVALFPRTTESVRTTAWAPYGYMQLKQGFFRASAMAIRAKFPMHEFSVETKAKTAPRGKGDSLESAYGRLEIKPEIAKQIEQLPLAQGRAIKEFLVAQDALHQKPGQWDLKVTIPAAYNWYMLNVEEPPSAPNQAAWARSISDARNAISALRVNRRLKSG